MSKTDSGAAIWGIIVIFLGITLLLTNIGVIDGAIWNYIFRFWPVLLVLEGLHLIMGNNIAAKAVLGVITLAVMALILTGGIKIYNPELFFQWGLDQIPGNSWFNNLFIK